MIYKYGRIPSEKDMSQAQDFVTHAQKYVPKFKVAFKNKSLFMKLLSYVLFFNKEFMTRYITTIGYTVYVPTEEEYTANPDKYLHILTHEFVHMMDYKKFNLLFSLSYLLPQLLAVFSLLSFIAIHHSLLWLFSLSFLVFATPLPAFFRSHWELRGYTMSAAFDYWQSNYSHPPTDYLDRFTDSGYYFMWPFKKNMTNRLQAMFDKIKDGSILSDQPFKIVFDYLKNPTA